MKSVYCAVRTGSLNKAVCCIYLRTNSNLYHLQHKLIGSYNRDEKCLLRGTNWVFNYNSLRFVFKRLNYVPVSFSHTKSNLGTKFTRLYTYLNIILFKSTLLNFMCKWCTLCLLMYERLITFSTMFTLHNSVRQPPTALTTLYQLSQSQTYLVFAIINRF